MITSALRLLFDVQELPFHTSKLNFDWSVKIARNKNPLLQCPGLNHLRKLNSKRLFLYAMSHELIFIALTSLRRN